MKKKYHNFKKQFKHITKYYDELVELTKAQYFVGTTNEWIIDNYYLVVESKNSLKKCYAKDKKIQKVLEDNRDLFNFIRNLFNEYNFDVDYELLTAEINAYQKETLNYLTYNSIALIPVIIAFVSLEKLYDLTIIKRKKLFEEQEIRKTAKIIKKRKEEDENFELKEFISLDENIIEHPEYIEFLNKELQSLGEVSNELFIELKEILEKNEINLKEIIKTTHDESIENNILVANIFSSIKLQLKLTVTNLIKSLSKAEALLLDESIYKEMTEETKALYREQIIKNTKGKSEYAYIDNLIEESKSNRKHIGFTLFPKKNLERRANIYLLIIIVLTIAGSAFFANFLFNSWLLGFILLLVPISELVIQITNKIAMKFYKPRPLAKLDFSKGIPTSEKTMVVIPTLISNVKKVDQMFENLEAYYLSVNSDNVYFTLLADCKGHNKRVYEFDDEIGEAGVEIAESLNKKYGKEIFYFVYRQRAWNESEGEFLGYERKRGGLMHFNKLLLKTMTKEEHEKYIYVETLSNLEEKIKYVITLDTDTDLGLEAVQRLVGLMAHPLNKPILNEEKTKVIDGYALIQPRVSVDIEATNATPYSQLIAGIGGFDVYSTVVPNFCFDVFGEGSFVGKGAYDLEVFEEVLGDTFPENQILSHDLLEGNYLRCAYASDIEFIEDFPAEFLQDTARQHRWARGDAQITDWIFNKVKSLKAKVVDNPLNNIERFKIFDNVRRQFLYPSLLLLLLFAFSFYKYSPLWALLSVGLVILLPILIYIKEFLRIQNKKVFSFKHYDNLLFGNFAILARVLISFITIPYYTYHYMDAFIRAMYRKHVSKKNLLNWVTAEDAAKTIRNDLSTYLRAFKANYYAAALLVISLLVNQFSYLSSTVLLIVLFMVAPFLLWLVSQRSKDQNQLYEHEKEELHEVAYRTWLYFEELLTEENHYLIPDNFQVSREKQEDIKTSPTDIGMSIMAIISAQEFDFIDVKDTLFYFDKILTVLESLEKWNGHLYNWIEISSLKKMYPAFVSSIDSANLAAALLTLKSYLGDYDDNLAGRASKLFEEMDFSRFISEQEVFSIGYDTIEEKLSPYNYNKFASESRTLSFVAIIKGDIDSKHWMHLDKTLTKHKNRKGLVSWSGTSFEYFMPLMFMKTYPNTLLDESYYFANFCQRDYMMEINPELPWGISESAYAELDEGENYKYKAFSTPYLKLIEDKTQRIVISPYSSALSLTIEPREVYENLRKFKKMEMYSDYGFYESYDYDNNAVVYAYFAHHQGMILTSLANYLYDGVLQNYFHQDLRVKSFELLLKEKVQFNPIIDLKMFGYKKYNYEREKVENDIREFNYLSEVPEISILSNSSYTLLINDRGNGFSRFNTTQLNRYRKITEQDYGNFLYFKDKKTGRLWSNTYAPVNQEPEKYNVVFATDKIKYTRYDQGISTKTEIIVSQKHDAEIRKITLKNHTNKDKKLEVTTYTEAVINENIKDVTHRTFNNLFVKSYFDEPTKTLLMCRKKGGQEEKAYYFNRIFIPNENNEVSFETERENFIGRNLNVDNPKAMHQEKLSNTLGDNIDPVMALRTDITVEAGTKKEFYVIYGFSKSRKQAANIIEAYDTELKISTAFSYATEANNVNTKLLDVTGPDMRNYNSMLNYLYQTSKHFVNDKRKEILTKNALGHQGLWKFDITGDYPIILVEISATESLSFVNEILKAYEYFKTKAIHIDLVIVNKEKEKYRPIINRAIEKEKYRMNTLFDFSSKPGKIFVIEEDQLNEKELILLRMTARLAFVADSPLSFSESIQEIIDENKMFPYPEQITAVSNAAKISKKGFEFYNGYGGFINNGTEYMISNPDTPTPWSNIIVNPNFGFIVTNNACGFTYAYNSQMFKISSWSNEIVLNDKSEGIKIDGILVDPSLARHGYGYSIFNNNTDDYSLNVTQFVALEDTIKFYQCHLVNETSEKKNFELTFWINPTFGPNEEKSSRYLLSEYEEALNSVLIRNVYNSDFNHVTAFLSSDLKIKSYSVDRVIMKSITVEVELAAGKTKDFNFYLGSEVEHEKLKNLLDKYNKKDRVKEELQIVKNYWKEQLATIKVKTPDLSFDYMMNGWFLYQTIASRLYAKAGFYQVGGAFGYRDQLQDCTNLTVVEPRWAKEQIIRNAKHQFREGDVLHWWHETNNFGLRSRYKDDYLWLVYATGRYIEITEDYSILSEEIPFVVGAVLADEEEERGIPFHYSEESASLYTHCLLSINKALNSLGDNGLPLIGGGDWNDGMNKVGIKGKGTSVWLGFFLHMVLGDFMEIAKKYDSKIDLKKYEKARKQLAKDLNEKAWDGKYYLRAFFDNGNKLGSHDNEEAKIDLISQSFSVLSGVAPIEKQESAIKAVENTLVDRKNKIIKLLTPPFKKTKDYPGYIMNYPEGVRENGGQYTHSVSWYLMSLVRLGAADLAYKYFAMINPINRSLNKEAVEQYKVEPYVVAADIYSNPNNQGRGGWTWYTGSAAWFYNFGLSDILGFKKRGNKLYIEPNLPSDWNEYELEYKYLDTLYKLKVKKAKTEKIVLDGDPLKTKYIGLKNDKRIHSVVVSIKGEK